MNNFFCTIGEKLANKIDAAPNPLLSGDFAGSDSSVRFQFRAIEVKEIREAIAKMKTSKSFGKDSISCYFLKLALPFIEDSLACLFNTSLVTSQFPDSWKLARVTPIFKEGDKAEKSNYRPISTKPISSPVCLSQTRSSWIFISSKRIVTNLSAGENSLVFSDKSSTMSGFDPLLGDRAEIMVPVH